MPRSNKAKHNWHKLKQEFFLSNFHDVSPFMKEKGITKKGQKMSNNTAVKTKGWAKEKQRWLEQQYMKATSKVEDELQLLTCELLDAKKQVLHDVIDMLNEKKVHSLKEYETLYKMLKIELREPINIAKGEHRLHDMSEMRSIEESLRSLASR